MINPISPRDAIADVVRVLNEALAADPVAVNELFAHSVWCDAALAGHPTLQVGVSTVGDFEWAHLRLIGLLNGVLLAALGEAVAAQYSENGALVGFQRYVKPAILCANPPPVPDKYYEFQVRPGVWVRCRFETLFVGADSWSGSVRCMDDMFELRAVAIDDVRNLREVRV